MHVAVGTLALLLRYLTSLEAIVLASGAVAFNAYALPRVARALVSTGRGAARDCSPASRSIPLQSCYSSLRFPTAGTLWPRPGACSRWATEWPPSPAATSAVRASRGIGRNPWRAPPPSSCSAVRQLLALLVVPIDRHAASLSLVPVWMPVVATIAAAAVETIPIRLE